MSLFFFRGSGTGPRDSSRGIDVAVLRRYAIRTIAPGECRRTRPLDHGSGCQDFLGSLPGAIVWPGYCCDVQCRHTTPIMKRYDSAERGTGRLSHVGWASIPRLLPLHASTDDLKQMASVNPKNVFRNEFRPLNLRPIGARAPGGRVIPASARAILWMAPIVVVLMVPHPSAAFWRTSSRSRHVVAITRSVRRRRSIPPQTVGVVVERQVRWRDPPLRSSVSHCCTVA